MLRTSDGWPFVVTVPSRLRAPRVLTSSSRVFRLCELRGCFLPPETRRSASMDGNRKPPRLGGFRGERMASDDRAALLLDFRSASSKSCRATVGPAPPSSPEDASGSSSTVASAVSAATRTVRGGGGSAEGERRSSLSGCADVFSVPLAPLLSRLGLGARPSCRGMRPNTILPSLVGAAPPGLETHGAGVCHCACGSAHALAGARACAPEAVSGATSIGLPRAFDGLMASLSRRNARGCGVNAGASCRAVTGVAKTKLDGGRSVAASAPRADAGVAHVSPSRETNAGVNIATDATSGASTTPGRVRFPTSRDATFPPERECVTLPRRFAQAPPTPAPPRLGVRLGSAVRGKKTARFQRSLRERKKSYGKCTSIQSHKAADCFFRLARNWEYEQSSTS